jgi:hypothetical protein
VQRFEERAESCAAYEKRPATSLLQAFIHQPLERSTDLQNA